MSDDHGYGWLPDRPDQRDHDFAMAQTARSLPPAVDLRDGCPPVYDQGQLGSCTANAIAAAYQYEEMRQRATLAFTPSRLFIYYNERAKEGTIQSDSGAMIRDGFWTLQHNGVCPESDWPYDPSRFAMTPPASCFQEAVPFETHAYQRVTRSTAALKGCLAAGNPVVIGFTVYESFESDAVANTGVMPMPKPHEGVLGGHAVLVVGYRADGYWIVRNSWGAGWGDKGYFYMPQSYLSNPHLSSDFWTLSKVV